METDLDENQLVCLINNKIQIYGKEEELQVYSNFVIIQQK